MERHDQGVTHRPKYRPASGASIPDLDRSRRKPAVSGPRCAPWFQPHAGYHRWAPSRFRPFTALYHQALEQFGRPTLPIGVHSPGHVAATDGQAQEEFWPRYLEVIRHVSKTRGFAVPTRASFEHEIGPGGALYVGSPETVARKIAANLTQLNATRFDLKFAMGGLSQKALMTNIELYGTRVVPLVRAILEASS